MLVFTGSRSSPGSLKGKEYYQNKRFVMLLLVVTAGKGGAFQLNRTNSSLWPLKAWHFIGKSADFFILLVAPTQVTYYSEMPKYHDRVPKTSETERTGGDVGDVCGFIWRGRLLDPYTVPSLKVTART